jgi:hypothetical protein
MPYFVQQRQQCGCVYFLCAIHKDSLLSYVRVLPVPTQRKVALLGRQQIPQRHVSVALSHETVLNIYSVTDDFQPAIPRDMSDMQFIMLVQLRLCLRLLFRLRKREQLAHTRQSDVPCLRRPHLRAQ